MTGRPGEISPLFDGDFDLSDGLGQETDNPSLRSLILAEIRDKGPMSFRRFMELALYHPHEGYYNSARDRIGRSGDYVTSPEVSPLFGYAIARQLAQLWRLLGSPAEFAITEHGGGNGRLARDVLRWLAERDPDCYGTVVYTLVEVSQAQPTLQLESLSELVDNRKLWITGDSDTPADTACVLANELLDSFPVHRVTTSNGQLREIYVDYVDEAFVEILDEPSSEAIDAVFSRLGMLPGEGCVAEVNLGAAEWLHKATKPMKSGYLLLLDYGYGAQQLYAPWRRDGTLLCYHRHSVSDNPYMFLGRQDMTSHVDFTSLALAASDLGLRLHGYTDQARFLLTLGVAAQPVSTLQGVEPYYARRRAVAALTDPAGLGRIGVVLLGKQAPHGDFLGFTEQLPAP